jgi:DNA-directed RNA polymerase subunit RPC12/RpoP
MEGHPVREFEFELPVGYVDEDGRLHKIAVLRKMTGHEEALLADRKLRQNGGRLVTELLANCLKRLGDITPVSRQVVNQLTSPDRNFLLVQLRKITFGQEMETSYVCPSCGEVTTLVQDLEELPVQRLNGSGPQPIVVELEDGYEDREGQLYTSMVFRLPTGLDEDKISPLTRDNASTGMNALLARCLVSVGDMPDNRREALGTRLLTDLTLADRKRIERTFRHDMPGVDMNTEIRCEKCGRKYQTTLDLTGFFSMQ